MIELVEHIPSAQADPDAAIAGALVLPFDLRQRSRLLTRLASGEEARLVLPRGTVLRGGDLLGAEDGRLVLVIAAPERLLGVPCASPRELARVAYHLGNRHVPVELREGHLCLAFDHVLLGMLDALGVRTEELDAPFEPEGGAYGGHSHGGGDAHAARIHEHG